MQRHPDVPFWVCVGDLADEAGRYEAVDRPLYWIKGNNENFDRLAAGDFPENLHFIPNARLIEVSGVRIAGLGGTFAPTWYDTPAAALPPGKLVVRSRSGPQSEARDAGGGAAPPALRKDDKRRHFVREEVEACRAMRGVDLLLTHEAPRPFRIGRMDAGKTQVNEVLAAMKPRLHLFGHHHRFSEQERQGVRSVGMDLVARSYLLVDAGTFAYEHVSGSLQS